MPKEKWIMVAIATAMFSLLYPVMLANFGVVGQIGWAIIVPSVLFFIVKT